MAREFVDIKSLLQVQPDELLQSLTQENSQLRLENLAQKQVINKLVSALQKSDEETDTEDSE
jgi:hypothetical protein